MIDLTADFLDVSDLLQTVTFYERYDDQNFAAGVSCSAQRVKDNRTIIPGGDDNLVLYDGVWLLAASQVTTPKRGDKILESSGATWIVDKIDRNSNAIATYRCYCNRASTTLPPVNTVAPVIDYVSERSRFEVTDTGTWFRTSSYTYQWLKCTVADYTNPSNYSTITGETNSYFTFQSPRDNDVIAIKCRVTGSNAGGSTPATSNYLIFL